MTADIGAGELASAVAALKAVRGVVEALPIHITDPGNDRTRQGRIIMISSVAAKIGSKSTWAAYNAAKTGVIDPTIALAKQLEPRDVFINALAPGSIATGAPMNAEEIAFQATDYPMPIVARTQGPTRVSTWPAKVAVGRAAPRSTAAVAAATPGDGIPSLTHTNQEATPRRLAEPPTPSS